MNILNKLLFVAALTAAISLVNFATAQNKPAGDGGIAASPKARQLLMKPITSYQDVASLKDGDVVAMACPRCKTITITYISTEKGHIKTATPGEEHLCPGCEQKFVVAGHGKNKHDAITHVCKKCGSKNAFCCVEKKDGEPTKGM